MYTLQFIIQPPRFRFQVSFCSYPPSGVEVLLIHLAAHYAISRKCCRGESLLESEQIDLSPESWAIARNVSSVTLAESMVVIRKAATPIDSFSLAPSVRGDEFVDYGTAIGRGDSGQGLVLSPWEVESYSWLQWGPPSAPATSAVACPTTDAWVVGEVNRTQTFEIDGVEHSVSFNLDHYRSGNEIMGDLPVLASTMLLPEHTAWMNTHLRHDWYNSNDMIATFTLAISPLKGSRA